MTPSVAALIVTYNPRKWIEECLSSLNTSTIPIDIYVIDNNSKDSAEDVISKYNVEYYRKLTTNLGFGGANNIGLHYLRELKKHDYIFLLNQDVYIERGTVEELLNCASENPSLHVISPLHLSSQRDRLDSGFQQYIQSSQIITDSLLLRHVRDIYQVPFVNAAAWFSKIETFEEIGGFNPTFFHYGEDVNFCHRMAYHNLSIGISTKARIVHDRTDRKRPQLRSPRRNIELDLLALLSDPNQSKSLQGLLVGNVWTQIRISLIRLLTLARFRKRAETNRKLSQSRGPIFLEESNL